MNPQALLTPMPLPRLPKEVEALLMQASLSTYALMDTPLMQPFTSLQRMVLAACINGYLTGTRAV